MRYVTYCYKLSHTPLLSPAAPMKNRPNKPLAPSASLTDVKAINNTKYNESKTVLQLWSLPGAIGYTVQAQCSADCQCGKTTEDKTLAVGNRKGDFSMIRLEAVGDIFSLSPTVVPSG